MKLYAIFTNRDQFDNYCGTTTSEEGETITAHSSSSLDWLMNDLGYKKYPLDNEMFEHKQKIFNDKFGNGNWTIEWVAELPNNVWQKVMERTK